MRSTRALLTSIHALSPEVWELAMEPLRSVFCFSREASRLSCSPLVTTGTAPLTPCDSMPACACANGAAPASRAPINNTQQTRKKPWKQVRMCGVVLSTTEEKRRPTHMGRRCFRRAVEAVGRKKDAGVVTLFRLLYRTKASLEMLDCSDGEAQAAPRRWRVRAVDGGVRDTASAVLCRACGGGARRRCLQRRG